MDNELELPTTSDKLPEDFQNGMDLVNGVSNNKIIVDSSSNISPSENDEEGKEKLGLSQDDTQTEEQENEWLDILGSGQLLKKIIKKGHSDTRPQRSDVCTIKYTAKLDDRLIEEDEITINLGDAEVIQGLDFALPLMDLEEESELIIGPRFAYGSLGRSPDVPPDATLHYSVKLINYDPEPLIETLSLQERKEIGNRKKERGNYWYARKDHTLAIQCYRRALEYLDDSGLSSSEESKKITEDDIHSLLEDRIKVHNNLAAAQMKIKAFDSALQSVNNVLRCQPNNVKALFRKGKILAEKGETEEGILLLKRTLSLDPDNVQAKNELNQLVARQKKDTDLQKKLYKKMLGANKPVENQALSPTRESRRWGMVAGCVGALFSILLAYKYYKPL